MNPKVYNRRGVRQTFALLAAFRPRFPSASALFCTSSAYHDHRLSTERHKNKLSHLVTTIDNNKKTSVKIVGAYDDVSGKYAFGYDKGAALTYEEFAVENVTGYGRSNKAQNAQLVWGEDIFNPKGILIAGGFGSARSTSGQVAGVLDGVPAAGTWTMKRSSKTFDALAKFQADTTANKEQEAKVAAFRKDASSFTKELAQLRENAEASAAELADLTEQIADATKAKADAEAAAKDAADKVAAAEATAKDAADKLAAAQADATAAQAAADAAADATNELQKAINDLVEATNTLSEAAAELADVSSNETLVARVINGYQTEVQNYIGFSVAKLAYSAEFETDVTNAVTKATNDLVTARAALADANIEKAAMNLYKTGETNKIAYVQQIKDLLKDYEILTNKTSSTYTGKHKDLQEAKENAEKAWKEDTYDKDGNIVTMSPYTTYTNAVNTRKDAEKNLADYKNSMAGTAYDTATYIATVNALQGIIDNAKTAEKTAKDASDKAEDTFNKAQAALDDFEAGTAATKNAADRAELKKKYDALIAKFDTLVTTPKWEAAVKELDDKIKDLGDDVKTAEGTMNAYAAAEVVTDLDPKLLPTSTSKLSQEKYDTYSKAAKDKADKDAKSIKEIDDQLAQAETKIKNWLNLATIIKLEADKLVNAEYIAKLQKKFELDKTLSDKDKAPVAIEAAAKWGIELKSKVK